MAAVNVTLDGVMYDLLNKTTQRVVIIADASLSGLGVGGGPVIPPSGGGQPPVGSGGQPTFPIYLPPGSWPPGGQGPSAPGGYPPSVEHPIAPGGPTIPPIPPDPPDTTVPKPPPPDGGWGWHPEYGWGYFPGSGGKPQPIPPPSA